jgi:hypothetical protein
MKTSNSVRCAVVVAVLGLSAALSAPQAFAAENSDRVYPADTCGKESGGANITRNGLGGIANHNPTLALAVSCSIENDVSLQIGQTYIETTDRNPGPTFAEEITCFLFQVRRNPSDSSATFWLDARRTQGASDRLQTLLFGPADPTFTTGLASANFYRCNIPPRASDGAVSEIHLYRVIEVPLPGGMSPVMLPPDAQEKHARAAVEAQEMRVK